MHILTPAPLIHSLLLSYITKFTTVTKPLQCYLFRLCTQSGRLFYCEVLPCTCLNVDACSFVVVILVMYQSIYIYHFYVHKKLTHILKKKCTYQQCLKKIFFVFITSFSGHVVLACALRLLLLKAFFIISVDIPPNTPFVRVLCCCLSYSLKWATASGTKKIVKMYIDSALCNHWGINCC